MGLDMYAFTTDQTVDQPVDFTVADAQELHYWRKHPNLHGWFHSLYRHKGGSDQSFNCVNLSITADDLDALEHAIQSRTLPDTCGFFFGHSDGSEFEDDLEFIAKARAAIENGRTVYYTSWW